MDIDAQIEAAIEKDMTINAIKLVKDNYGVSLAEAKKYVDDLSQKKSPQMAPGSPESKVEQKPQPVLSKDTSRGKIRSSPYDVSLPSTTVPEIFFKRKFLAFIFGFILLLGAFFPGFWHLSLFIWKGLIGVIIIASFIRLLKREIPLGIFFASFVINLMTIALLASMLIYPNGLSTCFSPVVWSSGIIFFVIQTLLVVWTKHPLYAKGNIYIKNHFRFS